MTLACKNKYTSESRLKTQITISYKYKNTIIFIILLTTCFHPEDKKTSFL